jgi:hypothetical protein
METPPTLLAVPWEPTPTIHVWMTILSTVVALVAGCVAFVLPFAVHMAGCIGDWFLVAIALRAPRGAQVEDMKDGLIFYTPAT